jgi:hypothetical protein
VDADEGVELAGLDPAALTCAPPASPLPPGLPPHLLLRAFVAALSRAAAARTLGDLRAVFGEGPRGLDRVSLEDLRALTAGCRLFSRSYAVLAESAGEAPPLAAAPQKFLWWLCAALPIEDAIKMEWLMVDSWGARAEKVAAFCWGLTEGTGHPEAFLIKIGRAAEAGHCHQQ